MCACIHVNKRVCFLLLIWLLLQGLRQELRRVLAPTPCLLVTVVTTHRVSMTPFPHFPRDQTHPRNVSPAQLHLPTWLRLIITQLAVLIYLVFFCWDSWAYHLLLCTLLHLGFTTTCILFTIGILLLNAAVINELIKKDVLNSTVLLGKQNPTCKSTACQLGLGHNSVQLPSNGDRRGNKEEFL